MMKTLFFAVVVAIFYTSVEGQSNICFEPPITGMCRAFLPSYYFNAQTGVCDCFVFGGCGSGANSFPTIESCMQVCKVDPAAQFLSKECRKILGVKNPILDGPQQTPNAIQGTVISPSAASGSQQGGSQLTPNTIGQLERAVGQTLTTEQILALERELRRLREQEKLQEVKELEERERQQQLQQQQQQQQQLQQQQQQQQLQQQQFLQQQQQQQQQQLLQQQQQRQQQQQQQFVQAQPSQAVAPQPQQPQFRPQPAVSVQPAVQQTAPRRTEEATVERDSSDGSFVPVFPPPLPGVQRQSSSSSQRTSSSSRRTSSSSSSSRRQSSSSGPVRVSSLSPVSATVFRPSSSSSSSSGRVNLGEPVRII